MKKRVNIITAVVLMALTGLAAYVITFYSVQESFNRQLETFERWQNDWRPFTDALENIENRYIGEVEQHILMQGAINGMVENMGDRWSRYFTPEEFAEHLRAQNPYIGIGVTVREVDGAIEITEVSDGTPAFEAELAAGDLIVAVDGNSVSEIGFEAAVGIIADGGIYSLVNLTIERPLEGEGSFEVSVMRRSIERERVIAEAIPARQGYIGVVRILNFHEGADVEFIEKVDELVERGVAGLVFDVRENVGGRLTSLVAMLDHLLPEGDLITLRYRDEERDIVHTSGPEHIDLPMSVIINENSFSAAEFFAATLSEYEKAVTVGERTGGKGFAQENIILIDGSGLSLSTSEYFTSQGISLDGIGTTPDIEVQLENDDRSVIGSNDPSRDRQLARAIMAIGN